MQGTDFAKQTTQLVRCRSRGGVHPVPDSSAVLARLSGSKWQTACLKKSRMVRCPAAPSEWCLQRALPHPHTPNAGVSALIPQR